MKQLTVKLKKITDRSTGRRFNLLLLIALLISIIACGLTFYKLNLDTRDPAKQLQQKNRSETKDVVSALGSILLLPSDKQPTVAKVEDIEKLKASNSVFYKDVQPKDYLILYSDRAIIYRFKENKIINIAPIVDTSKQTDQSQDVLPTKTN